MNTFEQIIFIWHYTFIYFLLNFLYLLFSSKLFYNLLSFACRSIQTKMSIKIIFLLCLIPFLVEAYDWKKGSPENTIWAEKCDFRGKMFLQFSRYKEFSNFSYFNWYAQKQYYKIILSCFEFYYLIHISNWRKVWKAKSHAQL